MDYFNKITEQALEGLESPLKAFIELKKEIDRLTSLSESIKRQAIAEVGNEDETKFERFGASITYVQSAGSRWDFSTSEDWKRVKSELSSIEDKHKSAYQAWKRGSTYIDENGEVISPCGYKEGNPTIQVKINQSK